MSSAQLLEQLSEGERPFVRAVLARLKKARTLFHIDVADAAQALGVDRGRVVTALDRLNDRKMIELRTKGVRHRYKQLIPSIDTAALTDELHRQALDREKKEIGRLGQIMGFVSREGCQVSALGAHFSEELPKGCGHCTFCRTGTATAMPSTHGQLLDDEIWQLATTLRSEHDKVLGEPRAMAQCFSVAFGRPR